MVRRALPGLGFAVWVALAACGGGGPTMVAGVDGGGPAARAPVDAAVGMPTEAGYDFRRARFHADLVGQVRPCDVAGPPWKDGDSWLVSCWNPHGGSVVALGWERAPTIALGDQLAIRIDAVLARQRAAVRGHLVGLLGRHPVEPDRRSGCLCDEERRRTAIDAAEAHRRSVGFDFGRLRAEPRLANTVQRCVVAYDDARVVAIDRSASGGRDRLLPDDLTWKAGVTCRHDGGTSRVTMAFAEPERALLLERDAIFSVRVVDPWASSGPVVAAKGGVESPGHLPPWAPGR